MAEQITKKQLVNLLLEKGVLVTPELLENVDKVIAGETLSKINSDLSEDFLVLNETVAQLMKEKKFENVNWQELEKVTVASEKKKSSQAYDKFMDILETSPEKKEESKEQFPVEVIFSYDQAAKSRKMQDFVNYYNLRFNALEEMLKTRKELKNLSTINRTLQKKERETVSIIGMVLDKQYTKNNNCILSIEDPTGIIKVLVNKNKPDLFSQARDLVLDEMIGICGVKGDDIIFSTSIVLPDVPLLDDIKKSPDEVYAVFLSDIHVGSTNFLEKEFLKFINWIKGKSGSETQRQIAGKVGYIFIIGDLVDGVGVYPNQESELVIKDIYEQYKKCAEYLNLIPKHIKLIICPGNHDAMRISEPQPALSKEYAAPFHEIENAILVSNPAFVNIHSKDNFSGLDVLLYHGYSFDFFVANVDSIRNQGGYDRADLVMKFLLRRRHLAPTHASSLFVPDSHHDPLVISKIPQIFATGHIHKTSVSHYKNITLLCGSCWQSKTSFQEKVGHHPEPCRVPVINLKTRQVKVLKFG
jgi:DNA polymerase II small subunit